MIKLRQVMILLGILLLCFTEGHLVYASTSTLSYENPNPIQQQLDRIQASIDHAEWEKAENEAKQLMRIFNKHKWKLQLLGDEGEYETIHQNIAQLEAAIKEHDRTESKMLIADIAAILEDIYSL